MTIPSERATTGPVGGGASDHGARAGLLVAMLLWGAQYPLTHDLAARWDVYTMQLVRYAPGTLLLLYVAARRGMGLRALNALTSTLRWLSLGGLMAGFGLLFTLGLAIGDPASNAVAAAAAPLTAVIVAWAVEGRRPDRGFFIALGFVVPGAILASLGPGARAEGAHVAPGVALILLAQACWALYSIRSQDWLRGAPQIAVTAGSFLWSCPYFIAMALAAAHRGALHADWAAAPLRDAGIFALLTVGSLVLGVLLWNAGVRRLGLVYCALHLNLVPIVALGVGYALGYEPGAAQIAGAVLVIAGVASVQLRPRLG